MSYATPVVMGDKAYAPEIVLGAIRAALKEYQHRPEGRAIGLESCNIDTLSERSARFCLHRIGFTVEDAIYNQFTGPARRRRGENAMGIAIVSGMAALYFGLPMLRLGLLILPLILLSVPVAAFVVSGFTALKPYPPRPSPHSAINQRTFLGGGASSRKN